MEGTLLGLITLLAIAIIVLYSIVCDLRKDLNELKKQFDESWYDHMNGHIEGV